MVLLSEAALREAGLRVTRPRVAVLEVLERPPDTAAGRRALFGTRTGDHHHHLAEVVFWGLCPRCQLNQEPGTADVRSST
jgi:hypothetical protein